MLICALLMCIVIGVLMFLSSHGIYRPKTSFNTTSFNAHLLSNIQSMTSPTLQGDYLYVTSSHNKILSIHEATGKVQWFYKVSRGTYLSPPVFNNGHLYVGDDASIMYKINPKLGQINWKTELHGGGISGKSLLSHDGQIVYVCNSERKYVSQLNAVNNTFGDIIWSLQLPQFHELRSTPIMSPNNILYFGSSNTDHQYHNNIGGIGKSAIYAVNAYNKEIIWSRDTKYPSTSEPTLSQDNVLYIVTGMTSQHPGSCSFLPNGKNQMQVLALNATNGAHMWIFSTIHSTPVKIKEVIRYKRWPCPYMSSPVLFHDSVYFGSSDGNLYKLNKYDGSVIWKFKTGAEILSTPLLTSKEDIYVTSTDGYVYRVNKNGMKIFEYNTGHIIVSSPVLNADESVLFVTTIGGIFKIIL